MSWRPRLSLRGASFVCWISTLLLGCAPRPAIVTTPERPELHASDYASDFRVPRRIEIALDCPNRFCVELRAADRLPLPDDATQSAAVLGGFMDGVLLPAFRDRMGFALADHVPGCRGGRALTVHASDFMYLAAFVNAAGELMSHYRSPDIQVCAGTRFELD